MNISVSIKVSEYLSLLWLLLYNCKDYSQGHFEWWNTVDLKNVSWDLLCIKIKADWIAWVNSNEKLTWYDSGWIRVSSKGFRSCVSEAASPLPQTRMNPAEFMNTFLPMTFKVMKRSFLVRRRPAVWMALWTTPALRGPRPPMNCNTPNSQECEAAKLISIPTWKDKDKICLQDREKPLTTNEVHGHVKKPCQGVEKNLGHCLNKSAIKYLFLLYCTPPLEYTSWIFFKCRPLHWTWPSR